MVSNMSTPNLTDITSSDPMLTGLCIFSAITAVVNGLLLIALKYTTAGKSSILVFTRSLCVADLLIGAYGIFKTILLQNSQSQLINCFLPDSVFVSATTSTCLTLLCLNIDSYLRLSQPLSYGRTMDKGSVVIAMMLVWNVGLVLGFLPQLGWNKHQYSCDFFQFFSIPFILLTCVIWILCTAGSVWLQVRLRAILTQIRQDTEFMSQNTMLYHVYQQLVLMVRSNMILLVLCYMPFIGYVTVNFILATSTAAQTSDIRCNQSASTICTEDTRSTDTEYVKSTDTEYSRNTNRENASYKLIFFLPVFLSRSFLSAFIHLYRTLKLESLTSEGGRSIASLLFRSQSATQTDRQPQVYCTTAPDNGRFLTFELMK